MSATPSPSLPLATRPGLLERLVALVYSAPCPLCAGDRTGGRLCEACFTALPRLRAPCCAVCALSLDLASASADLAAPRCGACLEGRAFARALVLGPYSGRLREAVLAIKFAGRKALAYDLGRRLGASVALELPAVPLLVVPVPMGPARRRERGFNQAEILAEGLSRAVGGRLVSAALRRPDDRPPQTGLGLAARRANVRGAFVATRRVVQGRVVLLVDDVVTTGATVEAAAACLGRAGAESIWVAALARTP